MRLNRYNRIVLLSQIFFSGCAPMVRTIINGNTYKALPDNADVKVFSLYADIPDSCIEIGQVKVGDDGFSSGCDYDNVIGLAKKTAREAGGNILEITSFREPDRQSTCYRITAKILFRNNIWNAYHHINQIEDSIKIAKFGDKPKFAILYVYRPDAFRGSLVSYDVHLYSPRSGDTVVCRAKNNTSYVIKLYKEGNYNIWAKTAESECMTKVSVKYGEEYFLKCSIQMGTFVGDPYIDLEDKYAGRVTYEETTKNKELK